MIRRIIAIAVLTLSIALGGCGGGGSTTTAGTPGAQNPSGQQTVSGVAAAADTQKIAVQGRVIKAFALDANGNETFLAQATTGSNGAYSLPLGTYSGAVVVKLFAADGTTVVQRAALEAVSGSVSVAVTPLTELAVKLASSDSIAKTVAKTMTKPLTATAIRTANALVTDLFNVNIITTQPVELTSAAFQTATTAEQRDYALILAALAEQGTGTTLQPYLSDITATGRIASATIGTFQTALNSFLVSPQNSTPVTTATTALQAMGDITYYVKLNIGAPSGVFAEEGFLKGITLTLLLPQGVSVKTTATDPQTPLADVIIGSGNGKGLAIVGPPFLATPSTLNFGVLPQNESGTFGLGEFATVKCDVAPGRNLLASDFIVQNVYATGSGGVVNTQVTVYVTVSQ